MTEEQNINQNNDAAESNGSNVQRPACACACSPWRWLIIIVIVIIAFMLFTSRAAQEQSSDLPGISWNDDYNAAMALAGQQGKPVLIAFHAKWCGYCTKMKKTTYHAPEVIQAMQNFIPIMIDTDQQGDIAQKYSVGPIPDYVIVKSDGTLVQRFVGYYNPGDFVEKLNSALQK